MASKPRITATLWKEITNKVTKLAPQGMPWPPIVFALYGKEEDHFDIVGYRQIENVKAKGDDDYHYPGIRDQGFYKPKGSGKWFSGTLVVGDGLDIDDGDKRWMARDGMDFRIKLHREKASAPWQRRVFVLELIPSSLVIAEDDKE
jgi:hypothetical protein